MSKKKNIQWWQCPECGWDPSDITDMDSPELFYYVEDGIAKPIKDKGLDVYPRRIRGCSFFDFWSGATGSAWTEIHRCPNCNKEFEFDNSTI